MLVRRPTKFSRYFSNTKYGDSNDHPIQSCFRKETPQQMIRVTFVSSRGGEQTVSGPVGQDLMRLAHANDIDLEGACEGSLACSTCHVVLEPQVYARLDEPSDEENDMLDLAFGLTETSRLGCQVKLGPELEGARIVIPSATRNMAVDGFKPKPH